MVIKYPINFVIIQLLMASNAISEPNELPLRQGSTANSDTKVNAKGDHNRPLCYTVNISFFFFFSVGFFSTIFFHHDEKQSVGERLAPTTDFTFYTQC